MKFFYHLDSLTSSSAGLLQLIVSVDLQASVVWLLTKDKCALAWAEVVQYFGAETVNFLSLLCLFQSCLEVESRRLYAMRQIVSVSGNAWSQIPIPN